jgi:hypothetical protein
VRYLGIADLAACPPGCRVASKSGKCPIECCVPKQTAQAADETSAGKNALGAKLERATDRALDTTLEILDLPTPDQDHPSFGSVLRAKNAAANTVINGQLKADENAMRKPVHDEVEHVLLKLNADFQAQKRQALEDQLKHTEGSAVSRDQHGPAHATSWQRGHSTALDGDYEIGEPDG